MTDLTRDNTQTEGVPEDFVAQLRDALEHLYDFAHLQRHSLIELLCQSSSGFDSQARALRHVLIELLETLNPGEGISRNSREWRTYDILTRSYVDGYSAQDIMDELHISLRQLQRDRRKGLLAVASVAWQSAQLLSGETARPQGHQYLGQEIKQLGLTLERVDIAGLVASIQAPAEALSTTSGISLKIAAAGHPVWVMADVTISRQALIGALGALASTHPIGLEVGWRGEEGHGIVFVTAQYVSAVGSIPDLAVDRTATITSLMRTQGGMVRVITRASHNQRSIALVFPKAEGPPVLLVDDNDHVLQLFERYLAAEGFRVRVASEASIALGMIEHETPSAIILDVMMRHVDGWQLLQQLRLDPKLDQVPIIVCTILNEPELARALGAQCYLKKPVAQKDILLALREVLARV